MATKTAPKKASASRNRASGPSLGQLSVATQDWFGRVFKAQSREFYQLLSLIIFLTGFGLVMVLSASFVDALKDGENGFSIFIKQALSAICAPCSMVMLWVFTEKKSIHCQCKE